MSLSGGERRRLEIARCLVSDPKIILLDEPFTSIDPVTIDSIQGIIRDLRERGIAILITDHQVRETLEITDRSYVIRNGSVLCHGAPREVLNNPDARRYYFGEGLSVRSRKRPDLRSRELARPCNQSTSSENAPSFFAPIAAGGRINSRPSSDLPFRSVRRRAL